MKEQLPPKKLIFVVGVWRSGTSLLYALLQNHPQIALMYEAEPLALFPRVANAMCPKDWVTRLEFFNQAISRHHLDAAILPQKKSVRESMLALFQGWAARKNATVMGGKSPSYHRYLPEVARIFPEAEFIIIWRNPLDVCRSVVNAGGKNRFFSSKGIMTQVFFGSERLARGVLQLRADGRRIHEVIYPDLVDHPEVELRKICSFLGLEFDARMLDLKSADCSMMPPGEHHSLVRSGTVKRVAPRPEVLPASFIAKRIRYLTLWRQRYCDLAFAQTLPAQSTAKQPGKFEQLIDEMIYRALSLWLDTKHLICRKMPLSLWQHCRRNARLRRLKQTTTAATSFEELT